MTDKCSYDKGDSFKCLAKSKGLWTTVSLMCCWSCLFSSSSINESSCENVSWKLQNISCITKQSQYVCSMHNLNQQSSLSHALGHLDQTYGTGSWRAPGLPVSITWLATKPCVRQSWFWWGSFLLLQTGLRRIPTTHSHSFQLWRSLHTASCSTHLVRTN